MEEYRFDEYASYRIMLAGEDLKDSVVTKGWPRALQFAYGPILNSLPVSEKVGGYYGLRWIATDHGKVRIDLVENPYGGGMVRPVAFIEKTEA